MGEIYKCLRIDVIDAWMIFKGSNGKSLIDKNIKFKSLIDNNYKI